MWGAAATAKSCQLCPTLCDPIDGSPPGSSVTGILQARTLEWVAISFSNAWKWKGKVKLLSRARLLATPWTVAYKAPPSMGFPRQEYWSGVPLPSPMWGECMPNVGWMSSDCWEPDLVLKSKYWTNCFLLGFYGITVLVLLCLPFSPVPSFQFTLHLFCLEILSPNKVLHIIYDPTM